MIRFDVLMGDYRAEKDCIVMGDVFSLRSREGKHLTMPLELITRIELIDEETARKLGRTLGLAALGAVVAGPLGLAAGILGRKSEVRYAVQLADGTRFVAKTSAKGFRKLTKPMVLDGRYSGPGATILEAIRATRTPLHPENVATGCNGNALRTSESKERSEPDGPPTHGGQGGSMKSLLQKAGLTLGLPIAASIIAAFNPNAGLAFVLATILVCLVAAFRPFPSLGLSSKGFNAFLVVWVAVTGLGVSEGGREPVTQSAELVALNVPAPAPAEAEESGSVDSPAMHENRAAAETEAAERQARNDRLAAYVLELIGQRQWEQARTQFLALEDRGDGDIAAFRVEAEARALALVRPLPSADIDGNLEGYRLLAALMPANSTYAERVQHYSARQEAAAPGTQVATLQPQASRATVAQAEELLYNWQPLSVTMDGSVLTVVLPQRQITQQIYNAVISTGICLGPLLGYPLPGVQSVEVLNQFSHQGYVYEAGTEHCELINDASPDFRWAETLVLGRTHSFSRFGP